MSDSKNAFEGELNPHFWCEYLAEKERNRQLADAAFVEDFWKFKVFER